MTNRIVFESDTPLGVLSLMAAAAAPHVLRAANAVRPAPVEPSDKIPVFATVAAPEQDKAATDTASQQQAAEAVQEVRRTRTPRKPKAEAVEEAKDKTAAKTVVDVEGPDGQMRQYETLGEAMEGMADLLDLCTTAEEARAWIEKNQKLIALAGDAGDLLNGVAMEHITELLKKAESATAEIMPAGDKVGEKPKAGTAVAEDLPEMSLDTLQPPPGLKRGNPADPSTATIADARTAFLAFCEVRGAPAGRKLLDKYQAPKVSELKPDQLAPFIVECAAAKK